MDPMRAGRQSSTALGLDLIGQRGPVGTCSICARRTGTLDHVDVMTALGVIGFVIGVVSLLIALPGIPTWWRDRQKRRWHVLDVWSEVQVDLHPVDGEPRTWRHGDGKLVISNNGTHAVTNVHLLGPEPLTRVRLTYWPVIAPGQTVEVLLTRQEMLALPADVMVELQVVDRRGIGWSWTPQERWLTEGATGKKFGLKKLDPTPRYQKLPIRRGIRATQQEKRTELERRRRKLDAPKDQESG